MSFFTKVADMSSRSDVTMDKGEFIGTLFFLFIGFFVWIVLYHFDVVALVWKSVRIGYVFLNDIIVPDAVEQYIGHTPSEAYEYMKNNSSSTYSPELVMMIERNYTWFSRIVIACSLIFGSFQVRKHLKIGASPLSPEEYLKLVVKDVPGEEELAYRDFSDIPLNYNFKLTSNQNAFRMPTTVMPFISCYPPIGFGMSEINRPICKGVKWEDYDKELAVEVFKRQLGMRTPASLKDFPEHVREAVGIMLGKFKRKEQRVKIVKLLFKRHYYLRTFMIGLLRETHLKTGVEPPKRYRFILHEADRVMYLGLHAARGGRAFYETMGVVSHFRQELEQGVAIKKPYLDSAIGNLDKTIARMQSDECTENNIYHEG